MQNNPKQTRLLGATVHGLGIVTAVSSTLPFCYAVCEGTDGVRRPVRLSELSRQDVSFPLQSQPFVLTTERIDYGVWDEVYSLVSDGAQSLAVAA